MDHENAFLHRLESIDASLKRIATVLEKIVADDNGEPLFDRVFGKDSVFDFFGKTKEKTP